MAQQEALVIDGLAVNDDVAFEMVEFDPGIPAKGLKFAEHPDADGSILIPGVHYPNRALKATLRPVPQANVTAALDKIAQIADKLNKASEIRGGIPVDWTPATTARTATFYCLAGEIEEMPIAGDGDDAGWLVAWPILKIRLDCLPYFETPEAQLGIVSADTTPAQSVVVDVPGELAASCRVIVTDAAGQARDDVAVGAYRGANADVSLTHLIDSASMTALGAATVTTRSGAYNANGVIRATLGKGEWMAIASSGALAHIGTLRPHARVYSSADAVYARFAYRIGDGPWLRSTPIAIPTYGDFAELEFDPLSIDRATAGTQRWEFRIEAYAPTTGVTFDVDFVNLLGADVYGRARAPLYVSTPATFLTLDDFDQTAGALTGKSPQIGTGAYGNIGNSANDFSVISLSGGASTGYLQRTGVNDTIGAAPTGRWIRHGALSQAATFVYLDFVFRKEQVGTVGGLHQGVFARYVAGTGQVSAELTTFDIGGPTANYWATLLVGGGGLSITIPLYQADVLDNQWISLGLMVLADGRAAVFVKGITSKVWGDPVWVSAPSSSLATGGAMASGAWGFYDSYTHSGALTRYYGKHGAFVPDDDFVIAANRVAEFSDEAAKRQDSTGSYYAPVPRFSGARFLLPPTTATGEKVRVTSRSRRYDLLQTASSGIADSTTMEVRGRSRWITVPRS